MTDLALIAIVVLLSITVGAQNAWLLTRSYYKRRESEREHRHELRQLRESSRE